MMKIAKIILVSLFVFLLSGCEDSGVNSPGGGPNFALTPMENEEAELLALHLSGQLIAPVPLYRKVKSDLEIIRDTWADSITHVSIRFRPYWSASEIHVSVSESAYESMTAGNYHYWDSLNDHYRIDTIKFGKSMFSDLRWADLRFKGRLNPLHLVDIYAGLPGFISMTSQVYARIGDGPKLLVTGDNRNIKYFFRYAWGDCTAGCFHSEIYYFTVQQNEPVYHGSYISFPRDPDPPDWLDTVRIAYEEYFARNQWPD